MLIEEQFGTFNTDFPPNLNFTKLLHLPITFLSLDTILNRSLSRRSPFVITVYIPGPEQTALHSSRLVSFKKEQIFYQKLEPTKCFFVLFFVGGVGAS